MVYYKLLYCRGAPPLYMDYAGITQQYHSPQICAHRVQLVAVMNDIFSVSVSSPGTMIGDPAFHT